MSRQAQEVTGEWSVPKSPEALGFCLAEAAHELTGRPIAVVVRDSVMNVATIVATSTGTDRRLVGMRIAPGSAIGRACVGGVRTHGSTAIELFGERRRDRREREGEGVVLPLGGEADSIGALVILGPPEVLDDPVLDLLVSMASEAGSLIGEAVVRRQIEARGMIDAVTGQPNQRALEQVMYGHVWRKCSLVHANLDGLDPVGAGMIDAVLRHVATVLRSTVRDYDIPARSQGGGFALFLPDVPPPGALTVANRVRSALAESPFEFDDGHVLTCSLGVASMPDPISAVDDLLPQAEIAAYEARMSGPNQVAVAGAR